MNKFKIMVVNGPNMNLLGTREPEIYGSDTLASIKKRLSQCARDHALDIDFRQSNHEGDLVTWIQEAGQSFSGIIINPAAYTHTSVAILDALKACEIPVIELHLSNPYARERFRRRSLISPVATGVICGFGTHGYELALTTMARLVKD